MFGQNVTEHNPAPSPSGHPLLSGPPTFNDIHQIYSPLDTPVDVQGKQKTPAHEELDTHHKSLATHKQATPRAGIEFYSRQYG